MYVYIYTYNFTHTYILYMYIWERNKNDIVRSMCKKEKQQRDMQEESQVIISIWQKIKSAM